MLYCPLNTSGAFHSRYMQGSREKFDTYLKKFKFSDLTIPVIANVSARPYQNDEIMVNLSNQITSSVKWSESIQYLMGLGDMEFEEIGSGDVLTKLVDKIREESPKSLAGAVQDSKDNAEEFPQEQAIEDSQQDDSIEINKNEEIESFAVDKSLSTEEKVSLWNQKCPIGTKVKSQIIEDDELETRTEAVVLFRHRAAVYMKGYNGYFDLDEITFV